MISRIKPQLYLLIFQIDTYDDSNLWLIRPNTLEIISVFVHIPYHACIRTLSHKPLKQALVNYALQQGLTKTELLANKNISMWISHTF